MRKSGRYERKSPVAVADDHLSVDIDESCCPHSSPAAETSSNRSNVLERPGLHREGVTTMGDPSANGEVRVERLAIVFE